MRGTTPAVIKQWLLGDGADRFVTEYENALDQARASLDLAEVHDVIERWRGIAVLQTDPEVTPRSTGAPSPTPPSWPPESPPPATNHSPSPPPRRACSRVYLVEPVGDDVSASIDPLPQALLGACAELRTAPEVSPWNVGRPLVTSKSDGLRVATIGADGTARVVGRAPRRLT